MTYENAKSIILTILVIGSAFFTWNLWTYQPKYETMENTNYVEEVSIGEKREIKTIIKPDIALFHYENKHYGTQKTSDLDKILSQLSQWEIFDVKNYTNKVEDFHELVHGDGSVEIIFSDEIPLNLYKNVLTFEDKSLPNIRFDRMVLNMGNLENETGTIYFVSYDKREVYSSHVSSSNLNEFNRSTFKMANQYSSYISFRPEDNRVIFLPESETTMVMYKYYPDYLESEKFKEALFPDPSFGRRY